MATRVAARSIASGGAMPRRLVSTVDPVGTIAQRLLASETSGLSIQPAACMRLASASMASISSAPDSTSSVN